jgi:hypothetical protein
MIFAPSTITLRDKMKMPSALLCFAVMLSTSGCSVLYDIGQDTNSDRCKKMPLIEDRDACMKQRVGPSYEQYERDRLKLKRGASEKS